MKSIFAVTFARLFTNGTVCRQIINLLQLFIIHSSNTPKNTPMAYNRRSGGGYGGYGSGAGGYGGGGGGAGGRYNNNSGYRAGGSSVSPWQSGSGSGPLPRQAQQGAHPPPAQLAMASNIISKLLTSSNSMVAIKSWL